MAGRDRSNRGCAPIIFDCDCTDIELGCVDTTSDNQTGKNGLQQIEDNLGTAQDILDCVTTINNDDLTLANIEVIDVPASHNGSASTQIRVFVVTDAQGRSASLLRTVTWTETGSAAASTTICPRSYTVTCGTPIVFDVPYFGDACGNSNFRVTPRVDRPNYDAATDTRDEQNDGTVRYTRTWTAIDRCDRELTCSQTIVEDCSTIGPAGCSAAFWSSTEGLEFWNEMSDPLVQAMPFDLRFTRTTLAFEYFGQDTFGDYTLEEILNGTAPPDVIECFNLFNGAVVALLNIAAAKAYPGTYPTTFQYPTGATDFRSLYKLVVDTITLELANPDSQQLCSTLAEKLRLANSALCTPIVAGCNLAFWSSVPGLALFDLPTRQLVRIMPANIRFTTETLLSDFLDLPNPGILTGITIRDVLTGKTTVNFCFNFIAAAIVTFLNVTAHPLLEFDFSYSGINTIQDFFTDTADTLDLFLRLRIISPKASADADAYCALIAADYTDANIEFCALVSSSGGRALRAKPAQKSTTERSTVKLQKLIAVHEKQAAPKKVAVVKASVSQKLTLKKAASKQAGRK